MRASPTPLDGVLLLEPDIHEDERGMFTEAYSQRDFAELGIAHPFVQDNRSVTRRGFLRGLHFQFVRPQAKLVSVERGAAYDVAVDLRLGSPSYGRYLTMELDGERRRMLYLPVGFAHGFLALTPWVIFSYKTSDYYSGPLDQHGVRWDDPGLAIPWPMPHPRTNAKDAALPTFAELVDRGTLFRYEPAH